MATQPQSPPPSPPKHEPPPAPKPPEPKPPEDEPDKKEGDEKKEPEALKPEVAFELFRNGERIAKVGDPKEKWLAMGRAADGTQTVETPMSPDVEKQIREGKFYKVD